MNASSTAGTALLEARGLCLARGGRLLLDDVCLQVRPGRTLGVLGANGAGKSLLLRVLHGLIAADSGDILQSGARVSGARTRTGGTQSMVFQRPVMLRRSVRANLRFALRARGLRGRDRERAIDEALTLCRLHAQADQPARSLSGGEQQRLAIARALVPRPTLLFLDEPTASLDPAATAAVEALIEEARARHVTPVLVTHDVHQARRLADDVIFLCGGRIVDRGRAAQVLDRPRSAAFGDWLAGRLPTDPPRSSERSISRSTC